MRELKRSLLLAVCIGCSVAATVSAADPVAVNPKGSPAASTLVDGKRSIFIGQDQGYSSTGWISNIVAIGYGGYGKQDSLAADTVIIGNSSGNNARGATVVGQQSGTTGENSTIIGSNASAAMYSTSTTGAVAVGAYSKAYATESEALGYFSKVDAKANYGVALGARSEALVQAGQEGYLKEESDGNSAVWTSKMGAVAVGSKSHGNRQITNVAAGTQDDDAVNVAQLKRVQERSTYKSGIGTTVTDDRAIDVNVGDGLHVEDNQLVADVTSTDIDALKQSISSSSGSVERLGTEIRRVDKDVKRVGAMSAALAGLHPVLSDDGTKWNVAVAGGSYKGEQALALGAFYTPNTSTQFSVGSTVGQDSTMFNVGASFKVGPAGKGRVNNDSTTPEASAAVSALTQEVRSLQAQHEEDTARIAALEAKVNALVNK